MRQVSRIPARTIETPAQHVGQPARLSRTSKPRATVGRDDATRHEDAVPPQPQDEAPGAALSELERVAHEYRRVREEHRRARPESRTRRQLAIRLRRLQQLVDNELSRTTLTEDERARWRNELRRPLLAPPLATRVVPAPVIRIRGPMPARIRGSLTAALARVVEAAPRPVIRVAASLVRHEDPAIARPFVARATLDVNGHPVRAKAAAGSAAEAIHLLEDHLCRKLRALGARDEAERRGGRPPEPGVWRHTGPRPVQRPAAERRIRRGTTYADVPMTPEDASLELELLGRDFQVFVDPSGEDGLVYLRPDGVLALRQAHGTEGYVGPFLHDAEPVPTISVGEAVERLNLDGEAFCFFVDVATGRGAVLYLRRDGHYGLVSASAPS